MCQKDSFVITNDKTKYYSYINCSVYIPSVFTNTCKNSSKLKTMGLMYKVDYNASVFLNSRITLKPCRSNIHIIEFVIWVTRQFTHLFGNLLIIAGYNHVKTEFIINLTSSLQISHVNYFFDKSTFSFLLCMFHSLFWPDKGQIKIYSVLFGPSSHFKWVIYNEQTNICAFDFIGGLTYLYFVFILLFPNRKQFL